MRTYIKAWMLTYEYVVKVDLTFVVLCIVFCYQYDMCVDAFETGFWEDGVSIG